MSNAGALKTVRNLTPDAVLFSPWGRLKIALLQLIARLLPGRFAIWLSLLDKAQLERQVRIKFGLLSFRSYDVPRLHLIVERQDWLTLQASALQAMHQRPDNHKSSQEQQKSGLSLKPILDILRRIDRELLDVQGRIRINIIEPDRTHTLTRAVNDGSLSPSGSFFDVNIPRPVLDHILAGTLDASSALLRGRIHVGGDTGLAARLVNALNPPSVPPPSLPTPNAYIGLGDHPLDVKAINLSNVFDLFGAPPRTAACAAVVQPTSRVTPQAEVASRYEALYDHYRQLYPALKSTFTGLADAASASIRR